VKVGELCAGYGGISMGLRLAGEDVDLRWLAEFDRALDVLHPAGVPNLGDITTVDWSTVEPVDLLTAGFPCQPVSAAGAQLAEADPRWLWPEVHRAVAALRPPRVLLENVRNLISMRKGEIWRYILADLTSLGYDVRWLTLGACAVGAAHHRHRVFALAQAGHAGRAPQARRLDVQECGARRGANGGQIAVPTATATDARDSRNLTAGRSPDARPSSTGVTLGDFAVIVGALLPSPAARDGDGRGEGDAAHWAEHRRSNGIPLAAELALLPTPSAGYAAQGGLNLRTVVVQPEHWGRFAAAVIRHAAVFGPPPAPTEPNRNGAPRLAPAFAEWLMCIPAGHVTDALPRSAALKAIGNGVCPPQLAQAWRYLTSPLDMSLGQPLASLSVTTSTTDTAADEVRDRQAAARARVIEATISLGVTVDPVFIQAAMLELAQVWREDAEYFATAKRRGWKSTADQLTQAAARLVGFAQSLAAVPVEPVMTYEESVALRAATDGVPEATIRREDQDSAFLENAAAHAEAETAAAFDAMREACSHPEPQRSTLKSGVIICTLCSAAVGQAASERLAELVPGTKRGPVITGDATLDYLSGATDTYDPTPKDQPVQPTPAVDNPFTSPAAPGTNRNRAPVKRLTFGELGPLVAATYPVPRPHLSHSYVESLSKCGLSALLSDASKAGHLGPRRPSWSLIGGNALHAAVEAIERVSISIGGADPATAAQTPNWEEFWEEALTLQVSETSASLIGTPYANASTWHVANKGLENYDWWRVQGLDMVKKYLAVHDTAWRSRHTLLQVPALPSDTRVPVLELPFTVNAGSSAITMEGRIDVAWLSTTDEYPTAALEVVDIKAGKSLPVDHFQLVEYGDVLRKHLPSNFGLPIVGRYYRARLGTYTPPVPLPAKAGQDEIDYRYQAAQRAMKHAVFAPHVDNMCSSCGSVDFCPAQSIRDGASA